VLITAGIITLFIRSVNLQSRSRGNARERRVREPGAPVGPPEELGLDVDAYHRLLPTLSVPSASCTRCPILRRQDLRVVARFAADGRPEADAVALLRLRLSRGPCSAGSLRRLAGGALGAESFQQPLGGLVGGVLVNELSLEGPLEDGLAKSDASS